MVNPQLAEYIKQQIQLGVPKEAIKSTLVTSGWPEADVNEALGPSSAQPAVSQPAAAPMAAASVSSPAISSAAKPAISAPTAVTGGSSPVTRDIFKPKNEPVFGVKPMANAKPETKTDVKPFESKIQPMTSSDPNVFIAPDAASYSSRSSRSWILPGVLGVLFVVSAGAAAYFFLQTQGLKGEGGILPSPDGGSDQQVSALTSERDQLQGQIAALTDENKDLAAQLAIFATPAGATTTAFTLSGTLSGGDKVSYVLTTARSVAFSVKNSKDAKVIAALKPVVGRTVELSGTYTPGSKDLTVTAVNGTPVNPPAPPAGTSTTTTPAAPTSTPPAATTTTP
ncbi:MAG: hypothetical protein UY99_C0021G0002 [Parcubacteria group bacterium GW2011_GWA1_59_11]|nr:MAG: hypothetical protein UY99_C0021G0002 [Parcubacteria group bacterium GW2011_GWA1_59_11]